MDEEILQQILQEIQSQSGTSWQEILLLMAPALAALAAGLAGAVVGIYVVQYRGKSELKKLSTERRLDLSRDRYMELQNALAEFIAALDNMLWAELRHVFAIFHGDAANEDDYLATYERCRSDFEKVRSSGRLSECRLKIGDQTYR